MAEKSMVVEVRAYGLTLYARSRTRLLKSSQEDGRGYRIHTDPRIFKRFVIPRPLFSSGSPADPTTLREAHPTPIVSRVSL